ncbi:MAG: polyprenol monophosphomannose synthase [Planctomycetales bacterium]
MPAERILITLCTYNEAENLPLLVPEIQNIAPQADLLVVDDNSPDGTGKLADEMALRDPRIRVLHRTGKLGLGSATLAAFKYAIDQGYDYVLNLDVDFSHHPRHIPAILALMDSKSKDRTDVAIGSRYVTGGKITGWSLKRHFMSRGVNLYARLLLGLRTRDNSGAFRCYRISELKKLDFDRIRATGYAFQEEILYRCKRLGCRIQETPIEFKDRERGQSKIHMGEAVGALFVILRLGLENLFGTPVQRPAGK